jgi:cellulose synthase/poly-beta-1,6-N-acetylglucosamine synthase-like glycosyltransferase
MWRFRYVRVLERDPDFSSAGIATISAGGKIWRSTEQPHAADKMPTFLTYVLDAAAILLAIPVTTFLVETIAALAPPSRSVVARPMSRGCIAALVPAHDESVAMLPTLADIRSQLRAGDRILVVADNCTDDTARVAAAAGAEVVERNDPVRNGKGYALQFGLAHLSRNPPEVVVFFDADCRLAYGTIDRLASTCAIAQRPVQALYLMKCPIRSSINYQVAEFAWRVKNWVRPLGLSRLGLPCQLVGTGMAFPFGIVRSVDLASGSIVEDLKLGLDLALAGSAPMFCPLALVTSEFAPSATGAGTQRQRWEHGHIAMISAAPSLIVAAVARGNLGLLALALDLAVPPLSLVAVLLAGVLLLAVGAALCGLSGLALTIALLCSLGFGLAIFLAWLVHGRDVLPPCAVVSIAPYVFRKLSMYARILTGRTAAHWIRTDRK